MYIYIYSYVVSKIFGYVRNCQKLRIAVSSFNLQNEQCADLTFLNLKSLFFLKTYDVNYLR